MRMPLFVVRLMVFFSVSFRAALVCNNFELRAKASQSQRELEFPSSMPSVLVVVYIYSSIRTGSGCAEPVGRRAA